ncbi:hypothetical protein AB0O91_26675 [Kitasatospora sp. NPDC089797]|uniref:hypothetical protein n=1 Tax=Kitasatospora sp. NPDC089797 TaxID=3155298 RepID=UPI00343BB3F4
MRLRRTAVAVLAGLSLALAAPALAHGAGSGPVIGAGGSQSDTVTISGSGLASPGSLIWDGSSTGSISVGGEGERDEPARHGPGTTRAGSPSDMELDVDMGDIEVGFTSSG